MADVTIAGKKVPRWAAIAGGAGALIAVYIVYRNHQANAAAAASSASTSTPIDPLTGYPQGSAEDQAALAAQQSAAYGGGYGYGGGGYGGYPVYSGGTQVGTTTGVSYPDNASWAQAVEAGLSDVGYSATDVSAAIGRYLAHLSVTSAQATIIYAAIAEYGPPPSGTYQVILQPTTGGGGGGSGGGGGGGGGGSTTVTVPNVVGKTVGAAHNAMVAAGLTPSGEHFNTSLHVIAQEPKAGSKVAKGTTFHLTPGKT